MEIIQMQFRLYSDFFHNLYSSFFQSCSLWEAAHSHSDQPLSDFYVPDLEPYIEPKKIAVGGLLRRLSQIPGRLNLTAIDEVGGGFLKFINEFVVFPLWFMLFILICHTIFKEKKSIHICLECF